MTENVSRRSGRGPKLTVIFWRDIPAQIKAKNGRDRASAKLPDRFMVSVDGAATRSAMTSHDDYIGEWREESRECGPDLYAEIEAEVIRITEAYPPDLVRSMVRNGGYAVTGSP